MNRVIAFCLRIGYWPGELQPGSSSGVLDTAWKPTQRPFVTRNRAERLGCKRPDKIAAFYADDASLLMPNMAALTGRMRSETCLLC